ncbi:hypothetical protein F5Y18DRAFT_189221 [Xylariaceae sp. FL1019]|nr:hypothetical protein F5Y18DRAFT_189221 [Xylariaceae sp. FL1019]
MQDFIEKTSLQATSPKTTCSISMRVFVLLWLRSRSEPIVSKNKTVKPSRMPFFCVWCWILAMLVSIYTGVSSMLYRPSALGCVHVKLQWSKHHYIICMCLMCCIGGGRSTLMSAAQLCPAPSHDVAKLATHRHISSNCITLTLTYCVLLVARF